MEQYNFKYKYKCLKFNANYFFEGENLTMSSWCIHKWSTSCSYNLDCTWKVIYQI